MTKSMPSTKRRPELSRRGTGLWFKYYKGRWRTLSENERLQLLVQASKVNSLGISHASHLQLKTKAIWVC